MYINALALRSSKRKQDEYISREQRSASWMNLQEKPAKTCFIDFFFAKKLFLFNAKPSNPNIIQSRREPNHSNSSKSRLGGFTLQCTCTNSSRDASSRSIRIVCASSAHKHAATAALLRNCVKQQPLLGTYTQADDASIYHCGILTLLLLRVFCLDLVFSLFLDVGCCVCRRRDRVDSTGMARSVWREKYLKK